MTFPEAGFSLKEDREKGQGDTKKRTEITNELDDILFPQLEKEKDPGRRRDLARQIREKLREGRRVFEKLGRKGKDELERDYQRLKKLEEGPS